MTTRPKHYVEYAFLRLVVALVCLLPLRGALAVGWVLAALSYPFMRRRRAEALRRMREGFGPDIPESRRRGWAWLSWRNLVFNVVELARAARNPPEELDHQVDVAGLQPCLEYQRAHGGCTIAVCHMGNWELAGFAARRMGLPIFVMMRAQSNPLITRFLDTVRERHAIDALERHQALSSVAKRIRSGGVFTILPDIRSKTREGSVLVPFLGREGHLMGGAALFARLTKTPVFTAIMTREGWTRHHVELVQPPIAPDPAVDRDDDVRRMMTEMMARFDAAIRARPDQYFWYNKRWVLDDRFDS